MMERTKCDHPDKCYECKKILTCTYYKEPKTSSTDEDDDKTEVNLGAPCKPIKV